MSSLKQKNDLTKSAWNISANIKDTVLRNVLKAISNREIPLQKEYHPKLVYVIQASVDAAFEASLKEFQKDLEKHVPDNTPPSKKK